MRALVYLAIACDFLTVIHNTLDRIAKFLKVSYLSTCTIHLKLAKNELKTAPYTFHVLLHLVHTGTTCFHYDLDM